MRVWLCGAVLLSTASCGSCAYDPPPLAVDSAVPDAPSGYLVGGDVTGMWDGATVAVRLRATGVDELATVAANGAYAFETRLEDGAAYTVELVTEPSRHTCELTGNTGVISGSDVDAADVACDGPAVEVTTTLPVGLSFDSTVATQPTTPISILQRELSFVVSGDDIDAVRVQGVATTVGSASDPVTLALGANEVTIDVTVEAMSREFTVSLDRGAADVQHWAYGKASNTGANDAFGFAVDLDGDTLVVGAPGEDSCATLVGGDQTDNGCGASGAVYVYRRNGDAWALEAYIKASVADANDGFGRSVALSNDTIVVGAPSEDSAATGVNGDVYSNAAADSGAAYVFRRVGTTWSFQANLKATNTDAGDRFGSSVAIAGDVIAVGAPAEQSAATTIGGSQSDDSAVSAGAVYVYRRSAGVWTPEAYIKPSNCEAGDEFGTSIALDGDLLIVGAPGEDSAAQGVGGDAADDSASRAGAAYLFRRSGTTWSQEAYLKGENTDANDWFGASVSVSRDRVVVGAPYEEGGSAGVDGPDNDDLSGAGAAYVFLRDGVTWAQEAYVKASFPQQSDNFGSATSFNGDVLAVAAAQEGSAATGIDGDEQDASLILSGAVYLYARATSWVQTTYVKASNNQGTILFTSPAIGTDLAAVGAYGEPSAATGFGGDQTSTAADDAGAVYVLR